MATCCLSDTKKRCYKSGDPLRASENKTFTTVFWILWGLYSAFLSIVCHGCSLPRCCWCTLCPVQVVWHLHSLITVVLAWSRPVKIKHLESALSKAETKRSKNALDSEKRQLSARLPSAAFVNLA